MSYKPSPHVRNSLIPEGANGNSSNFYQLNADSVSPMRVIGYDDAGLPIEDTVPAAYWRDFVHPCGEVNKVVLHTSPVPDNATAVERYEQNTIKDLIRDGWIPLNVCPYTFEFKHVKGGPLVKVPAGELDCGGHPDGCVHLKKIQGERRIRARAKHDADQKRVESMKREDVEHMLEAVGTAIARNTAAVADMKTARGKLKGDDA